MIYMILRKECLNQYKKQQLTEEIYEVIIQIYEMNEDKQSNYVYEYAAGCKMNDGCTKQDGEIREN